MYGALTMKAYLTIWKVCELVLSITTLIIYCGFTEQTLPKSRMKRVEKQLRTSHPPKIYINSPMIVAVCARRHLDGPRP